MRCFIYGSNLTADQVRKNRGIVAFAVPDIGLMFKAGYSGAQVECEYMSLLTMLRFAEQNPKVFAQSRLEVLSDAAGMVCQISGRTPVNPKVDKFLNTVRHFQDKMKFTVNWISREENCALGGIYDLPPLKSAPPLNTAFGKPSRPDPGGLLRGKHLDT